MESHQRTDREGSLKMTRKEWIIKKEKERKEHLKISFKMSLKLGQKQIIFALQILTEKKRETAGESTTEEWVNSRSSVDFSRAYIASEKISIFENSRKGDLNDF